MYTFHAIVLLPVSAKEKTENTIQQAAKNLEKKKKTYIHKKQNKQHSGRQLFHTYNLFCNDLVTSVGQKSSICRIMSIGQLENKYNEQNVYCNFQSSVATGSLCLNVLQQNCYCRFFRYKTFKLYFLNHLLQWLEKLYIPYIKRIKQHMVKLCLSSCMFQI